MLRKVLIAETEEWAVDLIREVTARHGFEVTVVDNGIDALEQIRADAPHLIIVDGLLPKIDGLQITTKIRNLAAGRSLAVILTSALHRPGEELTKLQRKHGFTALLPKPFGEAECEALLTPALFEEPHAKSVSEAQHATLLVSSGASQKMLEGKFMGEVLLRLMREARTGSLTAEHSGISQTLFFDRGVVVHARSNSWRDRMDRVVERLGTLAQAELSEARKAVESGLYADLRAAILQLGYATVDEVERTVRAQMSQIVLDLTTQVTVDYRFHPSPHLDRKLERYDVDAAEIVFWGMRRVDGQADMRSRLPSPRWVLRRRPGSERLRSLANLTALEEQVLHMVDGRRRIGDLLSVARFGALDVARVVVCLVEFGVIEAMPPPEFVVAESQQSTRAEMAPTGDLSETIAASVFAWYGLNRATGRLRLDHDGEWHQVFFDHGEIVWAQSSLPRHWLGAVLLDIGAVTEADLNRALKQQTGSSGHRLGGILLEDHALTFEELDRGRRAQIQRIVVDALSQTEGTHQFITVDDGALDRVTLSVQTTEIIFESLRHIDVPSEVSALLSSPGTVLMKLWDDARIDRDLSLSRSERRLLEVLETGQAAAELAAFGFMSGDELERVLHGFLVLEVVQPLTGKVVEPADPESASAGEEAIDPSRLVADLDQSGGGTLLPQADEDSDIIRVGTADRSPSSAHTEAKLEAERADNRRLRERIARLEAALDRRGDKPV